MKSLSVFFTFIALFVSVACQTTAPVRTLASQFHIAHNVQQFVTWETKANAVSVRSNEVIRLEHYEIPLRLLATDFEDSLDKNIRDSLIFKKNNELYVRWPINPEDTKWHLEVKSFLEKNKVDSEPKKFFDAYLTASRSMILVNPENGASFSLKVSTNLTGGQWRDKKQTWKDARQVRRMNKYVSAVLPQMKTESLVIMDEPLAMGIEAIDHGLIVRSLNDLPEDNHYYLPAFSALHEIEGARIAKLNGAADPVAYWEKHLVQPLANAMAEYFAATGAWYDSPHGQNFLVELDRDMKPTGRIVLRDLGDSYLLEDFVKNTKFAWIMKDWEDNKVVTKTFPTGIGLLKGNTPPKWLTALESKEYGWSFFRHFEKRFSELSGVPAGELVKTDSKDILFDYTSKKYPINDKWKQFTEFAGCFNGEPVSLKGEPCPEFITKRQIRIDCRKAVNAIINP